MQQYFMFWYDLVELIFNDFSKGLDIESIIVESRYHMLTPRVLAAVPNKIDD